MKIPCAFSSTPVLCALLAVPLLSGMTGTDVGGEKPTTAAELFRFDKVWDVHIRIGEDDHRSLTPQQGPGFDRDFPYVQATVEIAGHASLKVGLRYKGNSSYSSAGGTKKKSFKIDFNRMVEKQKFLGLTKLNLNNNILDPSQVRETLAYHMFSDLSLPASRTAFAKVYLKIGDATDEEYIGLYTMVEQVDDAFLKDRFGTKKGLLLKPERSNSFPYLGEEWADYQGVYVPKTEAPASFHERLMEFTRFVQESDDEAFAAGISDYVDLPELMKFTALHAVLSHLDSFLLRGHNFYIYLPESDGRFRWLPWDVNSTFAGHRSAGSGMEQTDLSISRPYADGVRLLSRIMKIGSARELYAKQVEAILLGPFKSESILALMEKIRALIGDAVSKDSTADFQLFEENFDRSYKRAVEIRPVARPGIPGPGFSGRAGMQDKPRVAAFIEARTAAILLQMVEDREGYVPRSFNRRRRR